MPCDIVIYENDDSEDVFIVIEVKSDSSQEKIKTSRKQGLGNSNLLNAKFLLVQCGEYRQSFDVQSHPSTKKLDDFIIADIPIAYDKVPKYKFKKPLKINSNQISYYHYYLLFTEP